MSYWESIPSPTDEDVDRVVRAWLDYHGTHCDDAEEPAENHWSVDAVIDAALVGGELLWRIFARMCQLVDRESRDAIGMIEAGPMWDLVYQGGDDALGRLERMAEASPLVLEMLATLMCEPEQQARIDRFIATRRPA